MPWASPVSCSGSLCCTAAGALNVVAAGAAGHFVARLTRMQAAAAS
ncbi:hypothetical protein ABZ318_22390 [Streptomyces sp. NPDC006197]